MEIYLFGGHCTLYGTSLTLLDFFIRSRLRNYPGRPQLQKISSNSQDGEYETKIEKFQLLLNSPQLDLVALKKLSWSGVPRKVRARRHTPK